MWIDGEWEMDQYSDYNSGYNSCQYLTEYLIRGIIPSIDIFFNKLAHQMEESAS